MERFNSLTKEAYHPTPAYFPYCAKMGSDLWHIGNLNFLCHLPPFYIIIYGTILHRDSVSRQSPRAEGGAT